ncbi:hypothetical protein O181_022820 [Austropuccinia psidii MF-1]|uniref:RNA polymerase II transcription factor B subunit 2 n=1 Tax=Austropuccinia psidii MF-1 TaxID=1389203 RepID=A0A9Q3CI59_9BASI|nr:hypothetical protein [Austropuccinia psidii MF-1]
MTMTDPPPATASNGSLSQSTDFASGLYTFLNALPKHTLGRLYNAPASCLAIFRLLPLIGRHLVLNMIWLDDPLPKSQTEIWASKNQKESKKQLENSIIKLSRLNIIEEVIDQQQSGRQDSLILNQSFKQNFRRALTGGGHHGSFGVPCNTPSNSVIPVNQLDNYGTEKWETILHYMVGSRLPTKPSHSILSLLHQSGLMVAMDPKNMQGLTISSKGFQFLLEDVNTQLWDILLQYLKIAEANGVDVVDVLACLFMLGNLELGQEYSSSNSTPTQASVLRDLADYGLVFITAPDRFYPTRLATTLTSSAAPLVSAERSSEEQGFLILETNYRVYAYTSNPLQIAVLNLFISLKYRFPKLIVGAVTRESINSALSNGITADQIVMYLHTHAHPQMRRLDPLLPPTVVDQIRLWELEKNRVRAQEGYLYEDFKSSADYDLVIQYSRQLGIIIWENSEMRKLFVGPEGHMALREFIRRRMGGG